MRWIDGGSVPSARGDELLDLAFALVRRRLQQKETWGEKKLSAPGHTPVQNQKPRGTKVLGGNVPVRLCRA